MKLVILGPGFPLYSQKYRGIVRETPGPLDDLPEPVSSVYWQYIEQLSENSYIENIDFAKKLVSIYNSLNPPQSFEIIEITHIKEDPKCNPVELLGFDIACAYSISILSWGLEIDNISSNSPYEELDIKLLPLYRLVKHYFQPLLNQNGLFDNSSLASECLEVLMSLQAIRPNLWEDENCSFQVWGLWKVL